MKLLVAKQGSSPGAKQECTPTQSAAAFTVPHACSTCCSRRRVQIGEELQTAPLGPAAQLQSTSPLSAPVARASTLGVCRPSGYVVAGCGDRVHDVAARQALGVRVV